MAESATQAAGTFVEHGERAAEARAQRRMVWRIALALASAVVLGLIAEWLFVAPNHGLADHRSSFSARGDGFLGLHEVLRRIGYSVARQRASWMQLPEPHSSLLVQLDPLSRGALEQRSEHVPEQQEGKLRTWLRAGGHVLATLPGKRVWTKLGVEIERPVGLIGDPKTPAEAVLGGVPATRWVAAEGRLEGRGELAGFGAALERMPSSAAYGLAAFVRETNGETEVRCFEPSDDWEPVLVLAGRPLVVTRRVDSGRVWLAASALPFTNYAVAKLGTGSAAIAVIDAASRERSVVFDEYVHGLWEQRGTWTWLFDTALFYPIIALLLLIALLAWRGAVRLGAARTEARVARRAKEEFVIGIADIALRAGRRRAAAGWILEQYRSRLAAGVLSDFDARLEATAQSDGALRTFERDLARRYRETVTA